MLCYAQHDMRHSVPHAVLPFMALPHEAARYLALAAEEDIVILQDGKPVALLRGFSEADDRLDYQIEIHPRFLERIRRARKAFHAGQSERLEDLRDELLQADDPS